MQMGFGIAALVISIVAIFISFIGTRMTMLARRKDSFVTRQCVKSP